MAAGNDDGAFRKVSGRARPITNRIGLYIDHCQPNLLSIKTRISLENVFDRMTRCDRRRDVMHRNASALNDEGSAEQVS